MFGSCCWVQRWLEHTSAALGRRAHIHIAMGSNTVSMAWTTPPCSNRAGQHSAPSRTAVCAQFKLQRQVQGVNADTVMCVVTQDICIYTCRAGAVGTATLPALLFQRLHPMRPATNAYLSTGNVPQGCFYGALAANCLHHKASPASTKAYKINHAHRHADC